MKVVNVARVDPALSVRVLRARELRYSDEGRAEDDRPEHVRAASGLAFTGGRLAVIQDDCAFIGLVAGEDVAAMTLPRGAGGRRRFEVGLGNKHEKYDLEACLAIGDDLFAFGSGSTPAREKIVHVGYATNVIDASPLYARLRFELGGPCNIEGVALVGAAAPRPRRNSGQLTPTQTAYSGALELWPGQTEQGGNELWLFHRGNTGPTDTPSIIRFAKTPLFRWLLGNGPVPEPLSSSRYDLGAVDGVRYGFTDAIAVGDRVFYLAAAEASRDAVEDGAALGSQLGVMIGETLRSAPLVVDGRPVKAEGLAFEPGSATHAWVAIDPDDIHQAAQLYEIELVGPW